LKSYTSINQGIFLDKLFSLMNEWMKYFNVHEAKHSLWDRPTRTLFSAIPSFVCSTWWWVPPTFPVPSLNKSSQALSAKTFAYPSMLSLKASHSKMKCFSVSTLPAVQKIHTLSAQASFGLFQRLVSQRSWWELVLNWAMRILAFQGILAPMYAFWCWS